MMIPGDRIRRVGYWTLDFLTGSNTRKHFTDIQYILENDTDPNVCKKKEEYLHKILRYATENVAFYKDLKTLTSLDSFPVVNKNIIRNNYEAFQSLEYKRKKVISMHTSGSTGTPFIVRQDRNKRDRVYAEMMYFWGKSGYQIGMKYVFFRIWTPLNRRSQLSAWARNVIMVDVKRQDEGNFEDIRKLLKSNRNIRMLLGYASTLDNLSNFLLARGDTPDMFNIRTAIGFGETLSENAHKRLKAVFNCKVISLYSNQENGMLAVECVENKEFHVNSASYYIEILKMDSNEPARFGEPGRVVITDLFNHAMPIIRYDIGDIGVWKKEAECGWQTQVLSSSIHGSMVDVLFDTKGNKVSTDAISVNMWLYDKLLQFQFIQEGDKQYVFKLNGAEGHYDDAIFVELAQDCLGQDAEIVIEHVSEIPVLDSGKRKIVVNHCKKVRA